MTTAITAANGVPCPGTGERPSDAMQAWAERGTCPSCGKRERVTVRRRMMRHYIADPNRPAPTETPSTINAVASRLSAWAAELNAPAEPSTVGEFVRAITNVQAELVAAHARIAELEAAPPPSDDWQWNFQRLSELLSHYAETRGWCSDYERVMTSWNANAGFRNGARMYTRREYQRGEAPTTGESNSRLLFY